MTLDGEADEIQSSILFRKLAVDAELQKEFRDAVSINHGAVKESENIVPSGKLTNNIFFNSEYRNCHGSCNYRKIHTRNK